ncbi:MAG: GxxExxY protein [Spirochaetia bacterium]|nr:GxxExxY protein [Spirochaetia bacterium]
MLEDNLTEKIIGSAFEVHKTLGFGFLEKVYENSLIIELREHGLKADNQLPLKVHYKTQIVGDYIADILVEDKIIIEIKAVNMLAKEHEVQLVNYLKATNKEIGLLINFGKSVTIKRKYKNHV